MERIKGYLKKAKAFSLLEFVLAISIVIIMGLCFYLYIYSYYNKKIEYQQIVQTKKILLSSLNQFYINNYQQIQEDPTAYATVSIKTLVDNGYFSNSALYDATRINYKIGIFPATQTDSMKLKLTITMNNIDQLVTLNPTKIVGNSAIWLVLPKYTHIAGKLKLKAIQLARFFDDKKM